MTDEYVLSVGDADPAEAAYARRESSVRGMILGLALGDARRSDRHPRRGTATSQLACFTAEGIVRAMVRGRHRGICHEPSVIWHAYLRWARIQQIPGVHIPQRPDGWLSAVSTLARRRGNAPAVVAALQSHSGNGFSPQRTSSNSGGHHALTRLVPIAAGVRGADADRAVEVAVETAAATHGHADVPVVVANGLVAFGTALDAENVARWQAEVVPRLNDEAIRRVAQGADPSLAAPLTARTALETALHVVQAHPRRSEVESALTDASSGPAASGASPLTGALLGAIHGVEALPPEVWDLELGHVMDTLARDLVVQFERPRDGGEYEVAADPRWWDRYPGS